MRNRKRTGNGGCSPQTRKRSSCGPRSCSVPEDEFFNRFAALARLFPALPLPGGGQTRFQPVFAGDVAEAIALAVDGKAKAGTTYELGGPDIKSFKELMEFMLATVERRRLLLPVPFALMQLQAMVLQFLPNPPLTPDQVELLKSDNVVSAAAHEQGRTLEALGIVPIQPRPSCPTICGASARPGNSAAARPEPRGRLNCRRRGMRFRRSAQCSPFVFER